MTDLRESLEERAAIIEEGEKCSRWLAQEIAAKLHGFRSWTEAVSRP
jgi:hypothetical protein